MNQTNPMREIRIEKVTLNCSAPAEKLEKAVKMLEIVTGEKAKKTKSKKRIPAFGIRPGLEIGCKVTLRKKKAIEILKRLLATVENKLQEKQFNPGSFAFGIKEYIEIPGISYQRDIGIIGLDVAVTLERRGFCIKKKKIKAGKIPKRHRISKEETIEFMKKNFPITIE